MGIGESADRCFKKIMTIITGDEAMEACGSDQLCSGLKAGIEGVIHGISECFEEHCHDGWGLLLTAAENAFNSISRPFFFRMQEYCGLDAPASFLIFTEALQY